MYNNPTLMYILSIPNYLALILNYLAWSLQLDMGKFWAFDSVCSSELRFCILCFGSESEV